MDKSDEFLYVLWLIFKSADYPVKSRVKSFPEHIVGIATLARRVPAPVFHFLAAVDAFN